MRIKHRQNVELVITAEIHPSEKLQSIRADRSSIRW